MFRTLIIVLLVSAPAYAQPDLTVTTALDFRLLTGETDLRYLRLGDPIIVGGRVHNIGTSMALGSSVDLSVNGVRVGSRAIVGLRPNRDAAFSFRWIPVAHGRQEVVVAADPLNLVAETSEANNAATIILNLAPFDTRPVSDRDTRVIEDGQANLAIAGDLRIHGTPRVDRGGSSLRFTVVNNGTMRAKNVQVEVLVDGEVKMTRNVGTLNPYASRKISINWKPEMAGTQTIKVVVDPAMHVLETSEADNSATLTVTVPSQGNKRKK